MTGKTAKQSLLLAGLGAVLVAVLIYQSQSAQPAGTGAPPSNPLTAASRGGAGNEGPVTDVRLDLLKVEAISFAAPKRDPFRFKPKPAPVVRSVAPPVVYTPPVPTGPPPPERIDTKIRLIGIYVTPDSKRVAALSDGTSRPIHGREGDIIEGRYRLLRIDEASIDVAYLDGAGRVRLPLSGR
jgi:hypothetical protein